MKELFREPDITRVSFFKLLLEEEGIPTIIRNEYLTMSGLSDIPIPEFFPALCVTDDMDYPRAVALIRDHLTTERRQSAEEWACPDCGEANPGNFEICWACGGSAGAESPK